jgi:hypothetical protein
MTTKRLVTGALLAVLVAFILIAIAAAALSPLESSPEAAPSDRAAVERGPPPLSAQSASSVRGQSPIPPIIAGLPGVGRWCRAGDSKRNPLADKNYRHRAAS